VTFYVSILVVATSYGAQDDKYRFEVNSSPYNVTYSDWAAKWWRWYVSVPKTESPNNLDYPNHIVNQTCSVMQDPASPVFFLFTPYVEEKVADRTCTIPANKAILIPIVNAEMDTGDPTLTENSTKGLIDTATAGNNNAVISVKLDGVKPESQQILLEYLDEHKWELEYRQAITYDDSSCLAFAQYATKQLIAKLLIYNQLEELQESSGGVGAIVFIALGTLIWLIS